MELKFGKIFTMEESRRNKVLELEERFSQLEKIIASPSTTDKKVIFDFGCTRWFSVSGLLTLMVLIKSLIDKEKIVKIRLPEPIMNQKGKDDKMARDFLRRWGFFETLRYYFKNDTPFFDTDQLDYLTEDQEFYLRSKIPDEWGKLAELYTSNVIEISSFAEETAGKWYISSLNISNYIQKIYAEEKNEKTGTVEKRILQALAQGINWHSSEELNTAKEFIEKCVKEPMENALLHANATMGLIAAHTDKKYFNIATIDNGVGIPYTLGSFLKKIQSYGKQFKISYINEDKKLIEYAFDLPKKEEIITLLKGKMENHKLIEVAHEPGVTEKPWIHKGMGLFLLKDFVKRARGYFIVRSGKGSVLFDGRDGEIRIKSRNCASLPGTLISIYLPRKS